MNPTAQQHMQQDLSFNARHYDKLEVLRSGLKGLPKHAGEKFLRQQLGEIEGVFIVDFKDYCYTSRVTTNKEIYRIRLRLDPSRLLEELKNYDPWSTRWNMHVCRMISIETVKPTVDSGDLLHAHMLIQFRKMALNEKAEDYGKSEAGLYDYEDLMEEEEEGKVYSNTNSEGNMSEWS